MFHHIIDTVTRQLSDVGLPSFVQHLRRTHAPPASKLVFTSLMGVTTTNGVSHHLVLCQKKVSRNVFSWPIEVLNHLVFTFSGVTLNCVACKSRKTCLSLLWWIRGQQLPSLIQSGNTCAPNNNRVGLTSPFVCHLVFAASWCLEVLLVTSPARFGTRHCSPCRKMWESGTWHCMSACGHRYDVAVHPILPRELRNGEFVLGASDHTRCVQRDRHERGDPGRDRKPLIMFVTLNVPVMNVAIRGKSAYRRSRSRRTACLSGTWQTRPGPHDTEHA